MMLRRRASRHGVGWDVKVVVVMVVAALSVVAVPAALADPSSSTAGLMAPFDVVDLHGIRISQYELSIDMGNPVTSGWRYPWAMLIQLTWTGYTGWVGLMAWLLDFTVGLSWAPPVIGLMDQASVSIRERVMEPLGAAGAGGVLVGLLFGVAVLVAVARSSRTGWAKVAASLVGSVVAVALLGGVLATPVATLAGSHSAMAAPLVAARNFGLEISAAAQGRDVSVTALGVNQAAVEQVAMGPVLVDALVRPVHQGLNYGRTLDGQPCEDTYNKVLLAGPYGADSSAARDAMGRCDADLGNYAKNMDFARIFVVAFFLVTGLLVGCFVMAFVIIVTLAMLGFAWTAFKMPFHALVAIVSPSGWTDLGRAVVDLVCTLIYLACTIGATGLFMMLVRTGLTHEGWPAMVRFVVADLLLITTLVWLITMWRHKHRQVRSVGEKVTGKPAPQSAQQRLTQVRETTRRMRERPLATGAGLVASAAVSGAGEGSPRVSGRGRGRVVPGVGGRSVPGAGPQAAPSSSPPATAARGTGAGRPVEGRPVAGRQVERSPGMSSWQLAKAGEPVSGGARALVPLAAARNVVASRKNRAADAVAALYNEGLTGSSASRSTRSRTLDSTIKRAGGVARAHRQASALASQTRSGAQRAQPASSGSKAVDRLAVAKGRVQRAADAAKKVVTQPRAAAPVEPRTIRVGEQRSMPPRRPVPAAKPTMPTPEPTASVAKAPASGAGARRTRSGGTRSRQPGKPRKGMPRPEVAGGEVPAASSSADRTRQASRGKGVTR